MNQEIQTIRILAILNEARHRIEQGHELIEKVSDLIWDKTAGHLDDLQMMRLATITTEDLKERGAGA